MSDLDRALKAVEDVQAGYQATLDHYERKGWPSGPPVKECEIFEAAISALKIAAERIRELSA